MSAKPILVPVDFGEASERAIELALDLSAKLGTKVVLLHVRPLAVGAYAYPGVAPYLVPALNDELEVAAKRALEELGEKHGIRDRILRTGDAASEILEVIGELVPAMVVMGTHGRKGLARFFVGSVAAKVLRQSPAPVLTVHGAPTAPAEAASVHA